MPLTTSSPPATEPVTRHPIRELIRTFGLLTRIMEPYFAGFGISGSQWGVLRNLHRALEEGVPALRPKELSDRLLIRPPSVTGLLDRLVRSGFVAREEATNDLRGKRVYLTPAGRRLVERILSVHDRQLERLVAGISARDRHELNRLLSLWRLHLEEIAG